MGVFGFPIGHFEGTKTLTSKEKIYKSQTLQHEKPALSVSPFTTSEEINNNHK